MVGIDGVEWRVCFFFVSFVQHTRTSHNKHTHILTRSHVLMHANQTVGEKQWVALISVTPPPLDKGATLHDTW